MIMSTRAIATSTLWQIASQVVMAALSIVTIKFVTIGLSKELAGIYNSAYGFLQLFGVLADFGLYAIAVREVSKAENKTDVLGTLMALRILILCFSLGTALLIVWILPAWHNTPLPMSATIAALVPFFTLLAGMQRTIFQVHYRLQYVFIAEVLQRIITTGLIATVVLMGIRGSTDVHTEELFLFIGGIGAMALFATQLYFGRRFLPFTLHWNWTVIRHVFWMAAPYGLAYLCMALYRQLDVPLITLLRPHDFDLQNAYYGFVMRMADMGFIIPTFLLNSVLPIMSDRDSKGVDTRHLLGKTLFILLLLGSTAFLFAQLWSVPLIHLLTTKAYVSTPGHPGSDAALRLISIPMLMNGMILYSFYVLLNRNAWRRLVATLLCGVVIALACNLLLIPGLGFIGASYTSIIVHVFIAAALLPQALRVMPAAISRHQLWQWLLFTLLLAAPLYLLAPFLPNDLITVSALVGIIVWIIGIAEATGIRRSLSEAI